jgi:hypothetical protein
MKKCGAAEAWIPAFAGRTVSKFAALGRLNRNFFTSAVAGITGKEAFSGREARRRAGHKRRSKTHPNEVI